MSLLTYRINYHASHLPGRGHRCARKVAVHASKIGSSNNPDNFISPGPTENFLSVEGILAEAADLGNDFVFEDLDADEPVWDQEARIVAEPVENLGDLLEPKGVLDPELADILTAYSSEQGFQEIVVDNLKRRLDSGEALLVLDVRNAEEVATGCIPGARNISMDDLSASVKAGALDDFRDSPIAVVCQSGRRSAQAVVRLNKVFGFTGAFNVKGGTSAWVAAGHPVQA